ncbi:MAG: ATPase [Alphaproteobacteria bacterium]|nr:ATPase [Alphaproteobacteria bacterium]
MKRFYKRVAVEAGEGGFAITLDSRVLMSAAKGHLPLPTEALASAIAEEWSSQGESIRPHTMPLMQLASTTADWSMAKRPEALAAVTRYAISDLLCYRAVAPRELVARQQQAWDPLLDWLADRHGARLEVTEGIVPVAQPPAALRALALAVGGLDPFALTTLHVWTAGSGSLVLGLALVAGHLYSDEAWALADLDGTYQRERWGEEPEAQRRQANLKADLVLAERFWRMTRH